MCIRDRHEEGPDARQDALGIRVQLAMDHFPFHFQSHLPEEDLEDRTNEQMEDCLLYTSRVEPDWLSSVILKTNFSQLLELFYPCVECLVGHVVLLGYLVVIASTGDALLNDSDSLFLDPVSYTHLDVYKRQR